jgi:ent-copalyl diphosphate synthase
VFQHFRKGDEFFCIAGQSTQAVTGMFNLYRASQVVFPGEKILEDAKHFAFNFLREKQAANELFDKWIIMKDLPSEVYIICVPKIKKNFYNI